MYNIDTNKIKAKIYEKGFTVRQIADELNIHEQTISNWINHRNIDNISKFIELLLFLDIDIKELKKIEDN